MLALHVEGVRMPQLRMDQLVATDIFKPVERIEKIKSLVLGQSTADIRHVMSMSTMSTTMMRSKRHMVVALAHRMDVMVIRVVGVMIAMVHGERAVILED